MDSALADWLEGEAKRLHCTKSKIMRETLAARRNGGRRRVGKRKPTLHEMMQEYCGIIKGGPKDYASNRKYLRGFGE